MADIFDVDNQENYDIPMSHEPSEEDYLASFEDKSMVSEVSEADFFGMMAQQTWIPEQVEKSGAIKDEHGILDWSNLQERINMDRHQLEMWGQSKKKEHNASGNSIVASMLKPTIDGLANINHAFQDIPDRLAETIREALDPTNPAHYNEVPDDLQHWDVVERMGWGYHLGCATKYIWRAGKKSSAHLTIEQKEVEDLQKAMVYIQKRIDLIEGGLA